MPRRSSTKRVAESDGVDRGLLAAAIVSHPREFVAVVMATAATVVIFVNALFLQHGPHPAPIFATRPPTRTVALPPARTAPKPVAAAAVTENHDRLVADIQRALAGKGFYDGAVDGLWGAHTDAAVRDFLQAAHLKIGADASEGLLRAIDASTVRAPEKAKAKSGRADDPIARLLASSKPAPAPAPAAAPVAAATPPSSTRVLAVQRVLTDFGYGQLNPTGEPDAATRTAIARFERDHGLPPSGGVSDRLVRELEAMTGRALE